jgi:hypothetical protein
METRYGTRAVHAELSEGFDRLLAARRSGRPAARRWTVLPRRRTREHQ